MQILVIRHGDPDYSIDSLTEKGWKEAELLAERLSKLNIKAFYVSPLGRAKDTASLTLEKMNREATVLPWMQEFFRADIARPDVKDRAIPWDWLPYTTSAAFMLPALTPTITPSQSAKRSRREISWKKRF